MISGENDDQFNIEEINDNDQDEKSHHSTDRSIRLEENNDKDERVIRYIADLMNLLKTSDSQTKNFNWEQTKDPVGQLVKKLKSMRRKSDKALPSECSIEVPPVSDPNCKIKRILESAMNSKLYDLTTTPNYNDPNRPKDNLTAPFWNSEILGTLAAAAIDPFEWRWLISYASMLADNIAIKAMYTLNGKDKKTFTDICDWKELYYYNYHAHVVSHFYPCYLSILVKNFILI